MGESKLVEKIKIRVWITALKKIKRELERASKAFDGKDGVSYYNARVSLAHATDRVSTAISHLESQLKEW